MKDKVLLYWNSSSYLIRSVMVYVFFSVFAIVSKLLGDKLGFFSSMIAIGFLISLLGVMASVAYALMMGMQKKIVFKEIFQAVFVIVLFLFLMNLVLPKEIKEDAVEEKNLSDTSIHNVVTLPQK